MVDDRSPRRSSCARATSNEAARTLAAAHALQGPPREYETLTHARLLLAQHHPSRAAITLDRGSSGSRATTAATAASIAIHVLQAFACAPSVIRRRRGERLETRGLARRSAGYRRVFLDEGPPVSPCWSEMRHVAPEFVDGLLEPLAATTARATGAARSAEQVGARDPARC